MRGFRSRVYGVVRRKKALLLVGISVSWSCRLLRLSAGGFVRVVQLPAPKAELCCRRKLAEGTSQDKLRFPLEEERFSCGEGAVWEIQIPPAATGSLPLTMATALLPSAEQIILIHC